MPKSRQRTRGNRETDLIVRSLALTLPPRYAFESHDHDWAQIIYAARGVMQVEARSQVWTIPPLRALWMPAGVVHHLQFCSETKMRTVYLHPSLVRGVHDDIRVISVSTLLRELILEVVRIGMLRRENRLHRSLADVLVNQLMAARDAGLSLPLPRDPRALAVADRVIAAPGDHTPLSQLSDEAGASARTIERIFAEETGVSFGRWRQQARLQLAVERLAAGESVTNVALDCGYESTSAFVEMFKKAMGTTPGKYTEAQR